MWNPYAIIDTILITEKNMELKELGKFVFKVHAKANKIEIARAIEEIYNVKVSDVNVINRAGKLKRVGRSARKGRRSDSRRAIVTLSEGTIEVL